MKAARKLILVGLLVMVLVICAACAGNEEKYDEIISEGKSLFKKEDYEKAERKFDEAIKKLLPREPDAYLEHCYPNGWQCFFFYPKGGLGLYVAAARAWRNLNIAGVAVCSGS